MKGIEERTDISGNEQLTGWENVLTATTPKGRVAQFVGCLSNLQPNLITHKQLFDATDVRGIETALYRGLAEGCSGGIATCFTAPKYMESSSYWVGRTGIHDEDDIPAVLNGDPD